MFISDLQSKTAGRAFGTLEINFWRTLYIYKVRSGGRFRCRKIASQSGMAVFPPQEEGKQAAGRRYMATAGIRDACSFRRKAMAATRCRIAGRQGRRFSRPAPFHEREGCGCGPEKGPLCLLKNRFCPVPAGFVAGGMCGPAQLSARFIRIFVKNL